MESAGEGMHWGMTGVALTPDGQVCLAADFAVKATWVVVPWDTAIELSSALTAAAITAAHMHGVPPEQLADALAKALVASLSPAGSEEEAGL